MVTSGVAPASTTRCPCDDEGAIFGAIFMNNVQNYEARFAEIKVPGPEQNEAHSTASQIDAQRTNGEKE
jgi:hypothetical protein